MSIAIDNLQFPSTEIPALSKAERLRIRRDIMARQFKEYFAFDSRLARGSVGLGGMTAAIAMQYLGRTKQAANLLFKLHRADFSTMANRRALSWVSKAATCAPNAESHPLQALFKDHIENHVPVRQAARLAENPAHLLGSVALVLKSATPTEKGVLLLQYSYTFPLFAQRFDLESISKKYYLVLEPDWSGYCDPNVLSYMRYKFPVFVQAFEPRDAQFIAETKSNLVPVPVSANWWVDHRLFRPLHGVAKDIDVVMVAGWGRYKRHAQFFRAISRLRRHQRKLRVLLLGYPLDATLADIRRLAVYYRIADQIEAHEWIPYEQVNEYLNRAKANVLWSRREGVNRAIIEAMFAGVPSIVRAGFNYGYHYPYINDATGCFAKERDLPRTILRVIDNPELFSPRDWVSANMTCQHAARIMSATIGQYATSRGERWSESVAIKINKLHNVEYWDPLDEKRFESDYEFLKSQIRPSKTAP